MSINEEDDAFSVTVERDFPIKEDEVLKVLSIEDVKPEALPVEVLLKLLDYSPLQILVKDSDLKYRYVNRLTQSGFKASPIGMTDEFASNIRSEVNHWRKAEKDVLATRRHNVQEVPWTDAMGRLRMNRVLNIPVIDTAGNAVGVAVIAHDITYRSTVEAAKGLLSLLQHDWVNSLIESLLQRIDNQMSATPHQAECPVIGEYSLTDLRTMFEFMASYLMNLPSFLHAYQHKSAAVRATDFESDVAQYMQRILGLLFGNLRITYDGGPVRVEADRECLRIMCFEQMKNHMKYGVGGTMSIAAFALNPEHVVVEFRSPGAKHVQEEAYELMHNEARRYVHSDFAGRPKDPSGNGKGLFYCRMFAVGHNSVKESNMEFKGLIYGARYDDELKQNVFWYRLKAAH